MWPSIYELPRTWQRTVRRAWKRPGAMRLSSLRRWATLRTPRAWHRSPSMPACPAKVYIRHWLVNGLPRSQDGARDSRPKLEAATCVGTSSPQDQVAPVSSARHVSEAVFRLMGERGPIRKPHEERQDQRADRRLRVLDRPGAAA